MSRSRHGFDLHSTVDRTGSACLLGRVARPCLFPAKVGSDDKDCIFEDRPAQIDLQPDGSWVHAGKSKLEPSLVVGTSRIARIHQGEWALCFLGHARGV